VSRAKPVPIGDHLWAAIAADDAMPLRRRHSHREGLAIAVQITRFFMPKVIGPLDVIGILDRAGVRCVLIGAYSLAGWLKQPRATQDVDLVVSAKSHARAVRAIRLAFPQLEVQDLLAVTRFIDPKRGHVVIDILKTNQPLIRRVLRCTRMVKGARPYRIPTLEMALALKFAPMTSPRRPREKRYLDAADFAALVKNNPRIDLTKLAEFGDLVYPNGGKEILDLVRRIRDGEPLTL
jgi:hypothetical protein